MIISKVTAHGIEATDIVMSKRRSSYLVLEVLERKDFLVRLKALSGDQVCRVTIRPGDELEVFKRGAQ